MLYAEKKRNDANLGDAVHLLSEQHESRNASIGRYFVLPGETSLHKRALVYIGLFDVLEDKLF